MLTRRDRPLQKDLFLQAPLGRQYVRSFLFSRRINAPFAQVHLIIRTLFIFCLSSLLLRTIDTAHPDPVGAILLFVIALIAFLLSGMQARVARLYLLLTLSPLLSLFTTWVLFNPVAGHTVLLQFPVYSGQLTLGFAFWELVWVAIVVGYFFVTRKLLVGILLATLFAFLMTRFFPLPEWVLFHFAFFRSTGSIYKRSRCFSGWYESDWICRYGLRDYCACRDES